MDSNEFPILCSHCLGPNPYVRMQREQGSRQCKMCTAPFVVFRWPNPNVKSGNQARGTARHRKTEICRNCALACNACQSCVLDINTGLPLAVRELAGTDI